MKTTNKKTERTVDWLNTDKLLRDKQELAEASAQAGFFAYLAGEVKDAVLGSALCESIENAREAYKICKDRLEGGVFDSIEQVEEIIRSVFFKLGVYKGFLARSSGKLQPANQEVRDE